MNTSHTPGPWKFSASNTLVAGSHGIHLGTFSESCGLGDAAEPNKALIAAAPDLLASLKELAFIVETVAHLQGRERELLPAADRARALQDLIERRMK
jgi:hypothetical protein